MPRIAGIDLPPDKRIEVALTYVYGVGLPLAREALREAGVNPDTRAKNLTESEVTKIREIVERRYTVEGELRRRISADIKRLKEIGSYRGQRHQKNLPVRGQRTRTNARTKRGRRQTIGGLRKEEKVR